MFKLDDNLLRELGLGDLPAAEKNKMLGHRKACIERQSFWRKLKSKMHQQNVRHHLQ